MIRDSIAVGDYVKWHASIDAYDCRFGIVSGEPVNGMTPVVTTETGYPTEHVPTRRLKRLVMRVFRDVLFVRFDQESEDEFIARIHAYFDDDGVSSCES